MNPSQLPTTPNLSTHIRQWAVSLLKHLGHRLAAAGVHPDTITVMGLGITSLAGWFLMQGKFHLGAVILIIGLPLDALDGAVARAMKRESAFGGVLDSTVDRIADMVLMLALAAHFAFYDQFTEMGLAFAALMGGVLVSYIRARAGAAGLPTAGGVFSRFERLAVLVAALLTGWVVPGLIVLAVGSNLTALHRLWSVARFARAASVKPQK